MISAFINLEPMYLLTGICTGTDAFIGSEDSFIQKVTAFRVRHLLGAWEREEGLSPQTPLPPRSFHPRGGDK